MTQAAQLAQYGANNVGLSFKNRIINGDMGISQRNGTSSVSETGAGQYTLDRWQVAGASPGVFSVAQSSTAPAGFTNSLLVTVTTADASMSGASYQLQQKIEGFNVADLGWGTANAQTVTLSFWVRSSVTGTFGGAFTNTNYDRTYPFPYTISAANTWEYKTITIPGDTTGTWLTTNGIGIQIVFGLGAQAGREAAANVWANTVARQPTGSVDLIATNGATFFLTGVQLEKGTVATSFDYLPYTTELALCQRYYLQYTGASGNNYEMIGTGVVTATNQADISVPLPVTLRAVPSVSFSGRIIGYDQASGQDLSSIGSVYGGKNNIYLNLIFTGTALNIGRGFIVYTVNASTGIFRISSEL
jgi:hypothetical protein